MLHLQNQPANSSKYTYTEVNQPGLIRVSVIPVSDTAVKKEGEKNTSTNWASCSKKVIKEIQDVTP